MKKTKVKSQTSPTGWWGEAHSWEHWVPGPVEERRLGNNSQLLDPGSENLFWVGSAICCLKDKSGSKAGTSLPYRSHGRTNQCSQGTHGSSFLPDSGVSMGKLQTECHFWILPNSFHSFIHAFSQHTIIDQGNVLGIKWWLLHFKVW